MMIIARQIGERKESGKIEYANLGANKGNFTRISQFNVPRFPHCDVRIAIWLQCLLPLGKLADMQTAIGTGAGQAAKKSFNFGNGNAAAAAAGN